MLDSTKTTDFNAIKLKVASPEDIMSWSYGEVTRPETINYRTQKPEKDGLFCERTFGPSKDWECYCGKYRKNRYKGIICDKCGVEVTRSMVRRERMGHIKLQTPATHIWFLRGTSSKISLTLDLSVSALEKVVYFANFVITSVNEELRDETIEQIKEEFKSKTKAIEKDFKTEIKTINNNSDKKNNKERTSEQINKLEKAKEEKLDELSTSFDTIQKELSSIKPMTVISENTYQELSQKFGHIFEASIGAEAIKILLEKIDLDATIKKLNEELLSCVESKKEKLIRRLKHFKSLKTNNIKPESMVLNAIPVIPPDLRPMVALDGGRFAASDLNDLYRRVINRNNRLKQLLGLNAPEVITRNEKRMLQEAVDALIDNSARQSKTVVASTGQKRNLKSLADSLKGKQGRFRQNLLGKRIDYSGRSVIVVNPNLNLNECGLPKTMAIELFKPFIISRLIKNEIVHNVRSASRFIEAGKNEVWDILEDIISEAYVLLNRAPTLHRLGIQAFQPKLIEGKAIQIHPLVCTAFNADFDGDQMAVHVPLTEEAKKEAKDIMLSTNNLLKPATGDPIVTPSQDIVWGVYYITMAEQNKKIDEKKLKHFTDEHEAKLAYEMDNIKLDKIIKVRINGELIKTTVGRIIFNNLLPEKLRFVNDVVAKGKLKSIVKQCYLIYGNNRTVTLLDEIKSKSFELITKSGLSWGINDTPHYQEKYELVTKANKLVEKIQDQYDEGLLTESERYAKIIELWSGVKEKVTDICKKGLAGTGYGNPLFSMIDSGARGSWTQLTQIIGMKGLVSSPSGDIIELPVKGNFKHGFDVIEYFISTHGVRKGLSDTALRTANAGYLTRRLVDVAQDTVINAKDCGDSTGMKITKEESDIMGQTIVDRITGRYLASNLKNSKGDILIKKGELINDKLANKIRDEEINIALIRSVLSCELKRGVCSTCYGIDLGHNKEAKKGTAVGVIAAQSIGEPGTQLTMRTFHTGGVASSEDITQGLPRVEEIFETRTPKRKAFIAEVDGIINIETAQRTIKTGNKEIITSNPQSRILKINYQGEDVDKYIINEAIAKVKLADNKNSTINSKKVKILVKNEDEISAKTELFKIGSKSIKAKQGGKVKINKEKDEIISIYVKTETNKAREYIIPKGIEIFVNNGDLVKKGDIITDGSVDLSQLYLLKGRLATQKYIIKEIQYVYSSQGQPLNDKHIEVIVRQMFSRYLVRDVGGTDLLPGEIVESGTFKLANEEAKKKNKKEAKGDLLLLGISKASLTTESFLSAASFQETNRVLIEAAINGKIDHLRGLKENVIVGRLIPVGTGYKK